MQNNTQNSGLKGLMVILAVIAGITLVPAILMVVFRFFTARGMEVPFMAFRMPFHFLFGGMPLLLLALWFAVTVWVYRDAESRGMNGALWAILTFFGNIIGLIIYLIVRSQDLSPAKGMTSACPSCSGAVTQGFAFCPHCGHRMEERCPSCGKPVQPTWHNCPFCGAALKQS